MRPAPFAVLAATLLSCASLAPAQNQPHVHRGYISAITSPTEFDLAGEHVLCDSKTEFNSPLGIGPTATPCADHIYIGEPLAITEFSRKHGALHAEILNANNMPTSMKITGYGVLDLPLAAETQPSRGVIHADGRRLRLTEKTQIHFAAPLRSLAEIHPGTWVAYEGHPEADGSLTVLSIAFAPNTISDHEAKMLKRMVIRIVPPDYAARKVGQIYIGAYTDTKRPKPGAFQIVANQATQERVQALGARLIPAWQRALQEEDPLRIRFQFFVVTRKPIDHDAFSFPDGTILIPEKIVSDLPTDAQLAAIIASNMAEVLEKQHSRFQTAKEALGATNVAAIGVGFAPVPFLGTGMSLGTAIAASEMQRRENQQADRVSLLLLEQAGYDVNQSFLARNAVVHKGKSDVLPYTIRAENLLADIGNRNAAALVHTDEAHAANAGWQIGHQ